MARRIEEILELETAPVGVRFLDPGEEVKGHDSSGKNRYCQALMRARHGEKVLVTADNITCPASAAALGLKPLADKLRSGEMLTSMGLFGNETAAQRTMAEMPRIALGEYGAVALGPLGELSYEPHVVVVEGEPEQIMWIALASFYYVGGRLHFNSGLFQATCADATVVPHLTGRLNASLGCFGCREATDLRRQECLVGFPFMMLDYIHSSLEKLGGKALPRARMKGFYRQTFGQRLEAEKMIK